MFTFPQALGLERRPRQIGTDAVTDGAKSD